MPTAENQAGDTSQTEASAASETLSIPKHRFDEVSAELRRIREEMALKDRLYLQERERVLAQQQQAQQPREVEITPEETGLDPQTHNAVLKTARAIASQAIARERQVFEQQIGILANRTEKAEFLAARGADKAKYLPQIQAEQQAHYQRTGGYMPAETAFDIIRSKELEDRNRALEEKILRLTQGQGAEGSQPQVTQPQAQQPQAQVTPSYPSAYPDPGATRQIPGQAPRTAGAAPKNFSEFSVEEMEARLEAEFGAGSRL